MPRLLLLSSALSMLACSQAVPEEEAAEPLFPNSEVHYLGSREAPIPETEPEEGVLVEPSFAFEAVDLRLTGQGVAPTLHVQLIDEAGVPGAWQPLPSHLDESPIQAKAMLDLEAPARALRLRGVGTLDFARLEFWSEVAEGHQGHNDDAHEVHDAIQPKASRPGRWSVPGGIAAEGEAQNVTRVGAGARCSGGMTQGANALGQYLVANFAGARNFSGYACRQIRGGSGLSVHAVGRAIDLFVPLHGGAADNDLGDPIAHWLIQNAEHIGVQLIIWDRSIWSSSRSPRHRAYGGQHPHHDHLHIELTPAAAERRTPWFQGGEGAPPPGPRAQPEGQRPCTVGGQSGLCMATAACEGLSTPGFCPGAADIQCCTVPPRAEPIDPPVAEEPRPDPPVDPPVGEAPPVGEEPDREPPPRAEPVPEGPEWIAHHRGLSLDGSEIPRRGLANSTLRGVTGEGTEPLGEVTTLNGKRFVAGRVSHFGGAADRGVSADETGAITEERLRSLNVPANPSANDLRQRPEDFYFIALRFNYRPNSTGWWRDQKIMVLDRRSGRAVVTRPVDWGPHTRTGRVLDVSPQTMTDLGVRTDAELLIAFADPRTPLGPLGAAAPAPEAEPGGDPCRANGLAGACMNTASCGGTSTPGLCPGPANIQCCTEGEPPVESFGDCRAGGEDGECVSTSDCWGQSTPGLCPGPNDIQCCT